MSEKEKENKYLVLKLEDIQKYLDGSAGRLFWLSVANINKGREQDGKTPNRYVVVNEEEPYAEKVWDLILGRAPRAKEPEWLNQALNEGDGVYRP